MRLQDEHRDKGLVIVGVHVKAAVKDRALDLCRSEKINFPIFNTGYVDYKGVDGTPTVFFFDSAGQLAHTGLFAGKEGILDGLLKTAPDWVAGPRKFEKVAVEAEQVRARRSLGAAALSLRGKAESGDDAEKEEATDLLARLEKYAASLMKRADSRFDAGASDEAMESWKRIASDFQGDAIGERASATAKEKAADPVFKRELEALKTFRALEKAAETVKPRRAGQSEENWRKRNEAAITQAQALFRALEKKFGDTKVCGRARDLLAALGL